MAQPIYKGKNGQFSTAVFENDSGKSVVLQKSYTDKEGKWHNPSITLFPKDIDKVIAVLEETKQSLSGEKSPEASASLEEDEEYISFDEEKRRPTMTKNKVEIIVEAGQHYAASVKDGGEYTSVGYSASSYGGCGPCDTEEEVQEHIKWAQKTIRDAGDIPILVDKREIKKLGAWF